MSAIPKESRPFLIKSMEGLEEGRERGCSCYGVVYEVQVNSIAKWLLKATVVMTAEPSLLKPLYSI